MYIYNMYILLVDSITALLIRLPKLSELMKSFEKVNHLLFYI